MIRMTPNQMSVFRWSLLVLVFMTPKVNLSSHGVEMSIVIDSHMNCVNITCKTHEASNECQFTYSMDTNMSGYTLVDGEDTANADYNYPSDRVCSLSLSTLQMGTYLVFCRMHVVHAGWGYVYDSVLFGEDSKPVNTSLDIKLDQNYKPIHQIGDNMVILLMMTNFNVYNCTFTYPNYVSSCVVNRFTMQLHYFGDGVDKGHCGIGYPGVKDEHNGIFWCEACSMDTRCGKKSVLSLVARAPTGINATLDSAGDLLIATCTVEASIPAASIRWMLGDIVLPPGVYHADTTWQWPWLPQTSTQQISVPMKPEYMNKILTCIVDHPALSTPLEKQVWWDYQESGKESNAQTELRCETAVYWLNVVLVVGILVVIFCILIYFLVNKYRTAQSCTRVGEYNSRSCDIQDSHVTPTHTSDRCNVQPDINEYAEVLNYQPTMEPDRGFQLTEPFTSAEYAEPLYLPESQPFGPILLKEDEEMPINHVKQKETELSNVVYAEVMKRPKPS